MPTFSRLPVVSCRWVFTIKHHLDGTVDRYKARLIVANLIARGFTQTYDMDYLELFSPVACLNSIRVLFFSCCQPPVTDV